MNLKISSTAKTDIIESIVYYNSQQSGLGSDFKKEINKSFQLIKEFPKSYRLVSKRLRMHVMQKYPFRIFYSLKNEDIIIVSVFHFKRDWDYDQN